MTLIIWRSPAPGQAGIRTLYGFGRKSGARLSPAAALLIANRIDNKPAVSTCRSTRCGWGHALPDAFDVGLLGVVEVCVIAVLTERHGVKHAAIRSYVPLRVRHRFAIEIEKEKQVLGEIRRLKPRRSEAGRSQAREQNYFANHAGRMNYRSIARRGWPIGSGAVESACREKQCRFKRSGQFWTSKGLRHLCALDEARRNHHWDQLWLPA